MRRTAVTGCIAAVVLVACNGGRSATPDAGVDAGPHCEAGLAGHRSVCIPKLSSGCKADEAPLADGGCQRVGVRQCDGGITVPPTWTCKPVGPPATCAAGWARGKDGWCEPLLPATSCPGGTMAVLGKSDCQPIQDCGSGTWGAIKVTANTLFVDAAHTGGDSDGSQAKPYTTIGAALAAVAANGHVAVAAGTYSEDLSLQTLGVTLEGRCPSMVTLQPGSASSTRTLAVSAGQATIRGLTITGAGVGVKSNGKGVVLERVVVQGCGGGGVWVEGGSATLKQMLLRSNTRYGVQVMLSGTAVSSPRATLERVVVRDTVSAGAKLVTTGASVYSGSELELTDSLVTGTTGFGVAVHGAGALTVERTVVERTTADTGYISGIGVYTQADTTGAVGTATLQDCLVRDNTTTGITVLHGGQLALKRCVVSGTKICAAVGQAGYGVNAAGAPGTSRRARVTISDSLIADNTDRGVLLEAAEATIERTIVRGTRPLPVAKQGGHLGYGVDAKFGYGKKLGSTLTLRDSIVEGNTTTGIAVKSSRATLERVVVKGTRLGMSSYLEMGVGIHAQTHVKGLSTSVKLKDSLVEGNRVAGVILLDAEAGLERSVIRATAANAKGEHGMGLFMVSDSTLDVDRCVVADNRLAGAYVFGGKATIEGSAVRDTRAASGTSLYGLGVLVSRTDSSAGELVLSDSVVSGNQGSGLQVEPGCKATVARCVVTDTAGDSVGHGDGLAARGTRAQKATLAVRNTLIERSTRAGVVFDGADGYLRSSVVRGGKIAVVLARESSPDIASDNVLTGNEQDGVVTKDLTVSAPPSVPLPSGP